MTTRTVTWKHIELDDNDMVVLIKDKKNPVCPAIRITKNTTGKMYSTIDIEQVCIPCVSYTDIGDITLAKSAIISPLYTPDLVKLLWSLPDNTNVATFFQTIFNSPERFSYGVLNRNSETRLTNAEGKTWADSINSAIREMVHCPSLTAKNIPIITNPLEPGFMAKEAESKKNLTTFEELTDVNNKGLSARMCGERHARLTICLARDINGKHRLSVASSFE